MSKMLRCFVVVVALAAFGMATLAVAEDFYAVKDAKGQMSVVDKKPEDAKSIVKGPFKTKAEAESAVKAAQTQKKPAVPPAEGC
jgi:hypothetical protein